MKRFIALLLVCGLAVGAGCTGAGGTGDVQGKVTVAGKGPLTGGITFALVSDSTKSAAGTIDASGSYLVSAVPTGECKVMITSITAPVAATGGGMSMPGGGSKLPAGSNEKMSNAPEGSGSAIPAAMGGQASAGTPMDIDPAVGNISTTTLTYKVSGGTQTKDFEVNPK